MGIIQRKGNLFVVSGPSGAGKGTLISRLRKQIPEIWLSVSATTRCPPRPGEVDGVSYLFKTEEEFDQLIASDGLLEWALVNGFRYGTPRLPVEEHVKTGHQVLLEIEPQGAFQVRRAYPEAILVFIEPPSMEELKRRLVNRGTESAQQIERRLQTAALEMKCEKEYDAVVRNDDLDVATRELVHFIRSHSLSS